MPIQQYWALLTIDDPDDTLPDATSTLAWLTTVPSEQLAAARFTLWENETDLAEDINENLSLGNPHYAGHIEDALLELGEMEINQFKEEKTP